MGTRFPSLCNAYDEDLRKLFREVAVPSGQGGPDPRGRVCLPVRTLLRDAGGVPLPAHDRLRRCGHEHRERGGGHAAIWA